jgi:serine/threonine protein phosphatase PrpC
MKCPTCGTDNRDGARFCRRCGATLVEAPVPPAGSQAGGGVPLLSQNGSSAPSEPALSETPAPLKAPPEPAEPVLSEMPAQPEESGQAEVEPALPGTSVAEEEVPATTAPVPAEQMGATDSLQAPAPEAPAEPVVPVSEAEPEAEAVPNLDPFWREDVVPLQPAPAGTVIDGRYALGEVLDVQSDRILYQARDLQRCWQCGFDGNATSEAFCARCGAALERKPEVRILELRDKSGAASTAGSESATAVLVHDGRTFLVLTEPEALPQPATPPGVVRLVAGQRSIPGQVRDLNEDSLLILTLSPVFQSQTGPAISLFAVADGMGGHEGGEVASKLALQTLAEGIVSSIALPSLAGEAIPDDAILSRLQQTVTAVNDAVYLARQKRGTDMGTTLTALLIRDQQLFVAHVGDSRAFRWNAGGLQQLTVDHSLVATMVARGQIAADEIYTHPQRSIIYRSIGDRPTIEVDTAVWPLAPGDRLLACSDGLWEMLRNEGIQDAMMAEADPQAACNLLVSRANAAGGDDNISVVVVEVVGT